LRKFTLDRWNWSERAHKWVYVSLEKGRRKYLYQLEPPQEFVKLTKKMQKINQEIMANPDQDIKESRFKELQELAGKLQSMGR
jgi:predicted transcriptional regulator